MSGNPEQSPSIEDLLKQARASAAYKDMPQEEFFLKMMSSLYTELKSPSSKAAAAVEEKEGNTVVIDKEFIYAGVEDAYIYRHKGKNYYYREKNVKTNRWENGISLKVGTSREHAIVKAQQLYTERKSKRARGILHKSINTKQLINQYLSYEAKRIKTQTKRGLTQQSYDSKIHTLTYWEKYIKDNGHERRVIEDIPPIIGDLFANWIDNLPKASYKDKPRDVNTINRIVSTTKGMYMWAHKNSLIGSDDIPKFKYMDTPVGYDQRDDRDIMWDSEYSELEAFLKSTYIKDKNCNTREKQRRKQFSLFIRLHYATGMRLKELINLRWNQISEPKHIKSARARKVNRDIWFPATKTSRTRTITSPITFLLDELTDLYREVGTTVDKNSDTRLFFNILSKKVDTSSWYNEESIRRRLQRLFVLNGMDAKFSSEMPPRRITPNSGRHHFATYKIVNDGWSYQELALHLGNSKEICEQRYSKATASMVRAKNMKNDGINRIENYEMKDADGKTYSADVQERIKDAIINLKSDN